jgi:nucleotide-binding universal stress UspA family protein
MTLIASAQRPSSPAARRAIRSLLVHVEPDSEGTARLDAAADLAHKLSARLIGVAAEAVPPLAVSENVGALAAIWIVEIEAALRENRERAEAAFRRRAVGLDVEWLALQTYPADALARLARGADLVFAGGASQMDLDDCRVAQTAELVVKCGRPVLVVPRNGGRLRGEAVVVAWKDTREARRAVADALPFLQAAEEVVVQEVCKADGYADAEVHTDGVVQHLKRHGVAARAKVTLLDRDDVTEELRATARGIDADLIVAGGYGHSRLAELIFGGVTQGLLEAPDQFVLFSH